MGLLDQVLGKFSDSQQSGTPASMSSMSPMVKGLLLLLATKAYHDYTTRRARRLRQGHDAIQRIFVGRFPAPADTQQGPRQGFR
jgi:hypothetical protein